jgi:hypothetical protein
MDEHEWMSCLDPKEMLTCVDISPARLHGRNMNPARALSPAVFLVLRQCDPRNLRLFHVYCCRRIWDRFSCKSSRIAVEFADRYAEGGDDFEGRKKVYADA